jgi:hypothetical protein
MHLQLNDEQKQLLEEISNLAGIQRAVIREVWEFTLISWVEKITKKTAENPNGLTSLDIPFLGKVGVRYNGDEQTASGTVTTNVAAFVTLDPLFTKLIGDIIDEKDSIITDLLIQKAENALLTINTSE